MGKYDSLSTEERVSRAKDLIENCKVISDYYEPWEIDTKYKVIRKKGRPSFTWKEEYGKYVDTSTLSTVSALLGRDKKKILKRKTRRVLERNAKKKSTRKKIAGALGLTSLDKKSKRSDKSDYLKLSPIPAQALVDYLQLPLSSTIWNPCALKGHLSKVLTLNGFSNVISSDVLDFNFGAAGVDFLVHKFDKYDWLITFPPPSKIERFIIRAYKYKKPFAFFIKSSFWHSQKRRDLFLATKPTHVLPLTWRPDFDFIVDNKVGTDELFVRRRAGGGLIDYMWVVWGPDSFKRPVGEHYLSEDFLTEYYPLKKPTHYPRLDIEANLIKPFFPLLKEGE